MGKLIEMSGKRFGKLIVLNRVGSDRFNLALWQCKCDCGTERVITGGNLRRGDHISCGCAKIKHGMTRNGKHHPYYNAWGTMIQRCTNPKATGYSYYGGRGITVCDRWLNSFKNFLDDMGSKPTSSHTLDRIDNNEGYFPANCRWATRKEQSNNRRNNTTLGIAV